MYSGEREFRNAWQVFREADGAITLTDATVVAWARMEMLPLLTYDVAQARFAKGAS